ncbi:selenocysteine-specific translation elongation factor [Helicobacter sp. 11S02596-1]|uniref:selenocysteine-specific translation elongation factor n=1 Tax=Helicobacter sp. 11S02596-1 TaxID=1476194 RepID=UPI000BA55504|nr:selenocysteine-specific translation elongation factor [Helicobacter sp. 11S02596-1]PAF42462.1 selenocysteine-specific translation elongation factor [Helicobacter sp. 11S02596-1]
MENDIIIGLGGHIDHGKTSLIKALNGFDGDNAPEEKERGITLDMSFSHLSLHPNPSQPNQTKNIAFIDVPGHEKLIKNMIAGSFGIDVLLLVVSASEGIMPQTIEHLQIADILGVKLGICVITKIDLLVDMPESERTQKCQDLKKQIQAQFDKLRSLKLGKILEFSTHIQATKTQLINTLSEISKPPKQPASFFRCYIDRAFSLKGAGTIVTGTMLSGKLSKNESVVICELQTQALIKNISHHNNFIDEATPGQRIALNLKTIPSTALKRGFLLSKKGCIRGFDTIDVVIYPLIPMPWHNLEVQFFIGSKKCNAKIFSLEPSMQDDKPYLLATLKTDEKIFGIFGEKFILRHSDKTIGGGEILNPITEMMKKKQKYIYCNFLLQKDFKQAFWQCACVHKKGFGLISSAQRFNLTHQDALKIAQEIPEIFLDSKNLVIYHPQTFQDLKNDILQTFAKNKNALLSPVSVQQKIKWASSDFIFKALEVLAEDGFIYQKEGLYLSKQNNIKNIAEYLQDTLYQTILAQNFAPLAPYDIYDNLHIDPKSGDNALKSLCSAKKIIRLQHNLFIAQSALKNLHLQMRSLISQHGYIDIALLKTRLGLSRKYLIAYLDSLDWFEDIQNTQGKRTFKYANTQK